MRPLGRCARRTVWGRLVSFRGACGREKRTARANDDKENVLSTSETKRETATDPVVRQYREQISDNDLKILEAVNKRITLVRKLWDYKDAQGINFVDPAQEDWILTYLSRSNRGPLSDDGLREIFSVVLAVVKREMSAE